MVDRISSFSQSQSLLSSMMRLQAQYATTQTQVSTEQKSDNYQGLGSDTSDILSLESDYAKLVNQSENTQSALDTTNLIYEKLDSISDIGQSILDDLNATISGTGVSESELADMADNYLDQIVSILNTQVSGRYIFAGSATGTAPVDLDSYTGTAGITLPSTADASYYQGNDYIQSIEVADGYTVEYGITADNEVFENLIRSFDLIINASTTDDSAAALTEAYDLLNSALDELENLKASTSQDSQLFDQFIDDSLTDLNLIDSLIADLTEVDLAEVSVKLTELETQLEASYSVTTKLLNLNLSDYL